MATTNDAGDRIYDEFFSGDLAVQIDLTQDSVVFMDAGGREIVRTTLSDAKNVAGHIAELLAGAIVQEENAPEDPPEEPEEIEGEAEEVTDESSEAE